MPELPEIETVVRTLRPALENRTVTEIRFGAHGRDVIACPDAEAFLTLLTGSRFTALSRRGKFIRLHTDDGLCLVVHLRMTGRLLVAAAATAEKPHTHVVLQLDNGDELRFSDARRFGRLWLIPPGETDTVSGVGRLGVEPLSDDFGSDLLRHKLGPRRTTIKQALLDQRVVAGLGNIYADESLFLARIHPQRCCETLSEAEWAALAAAIPAVLENAIVHNGTTFSDFLDGTGREGENMAFLQVYGRTGQPCPRCGAMIEKIRVGGRGTHFCPVCQQIEGKEAAAL